MGRGRSLKLARWQALERMTLKPSKKSVSRPLLFILLAAFLIRGAMLLVVVENPERAIRRDSGSYLRTAGNVLEGNGFSQSEEPPFAPSALRTPTYPLFLALAIYLFGHSPAAIAALQVLVDVASVFLVTLIGRRLFSEGAALLAGLLYALSLVAIVHSVFVLTETLFTFLILGAVASLVFYSVGQRKRWLLLAGILSGLAMLCRPIAVFFPLVILVSIALIHRGRLRTAPVPALSYLLLTVLVVTPWLIRNERRLGTPALSTISSSSLYLYNAVALVAERQGIGANEARGVMLRQADMELAESGWAEDEVRRAELYGAWGREIILSDPLRYLFIHLRSDLNSLLPAVADFLELLGVTEGAKGTLSVLNQDGIVAAVNHYLEGRSWLLLPLSPLILLLALTYLGSAIGSIRLFLERRWFTLSMLLLPTLGFLLAAGPAANPRFRAPVMPTICLLAGLGVVYAYGRISKKWRLRFSVSGKEEA